MRTKLLHWKRISLFLILLALVCPWVQALTTTNTFEFYKNSSMTEVDPRVKLEITKAPKVIGGTTENPVYATDIIDVRLFVLKGFELSTFRRDNGNNSYQDFYDTSSYNLVEDDGTWLTYSTTDLWKFTDVYSCNKTTGYISINNGFFYVENITISPIKDITDLYNVFNYYKPNSTTIENGELVMAESNYSVGLENNPLKFIKGDSPIIIRKFRVSSTEISVDGGDVTLIGKEGFANTITFPDMNLISGSLHISDGYVRNLSMTSGELTLEGENAHIYKASVSGGSIYYKNRDDGHPYIRKAYDNEANTKSRLSIEGNVHIQGEGIGYLTSFADIKNSVVTSETDIKDFSPCGNERAHSFVKDTAIIDASSVFFNKEDLSSMKEMIIKGASNVEMNYVHFRQDSHDNHDDSFVDKPIHLEDGNLLLNKSNLTSTFYYGEEHKGEHIIEQTGGTLQIKNSDISAPILVNGDQAKAEFVSGDMTGNNTYVEVLLGNLDIKGGKINGVLMKGGSLNVSGGYFDGGIQVDADCKIALSGGYYRSSAIVFSEGVTVPASSSLLVSGYEFGDDYINTVYPLGTDLKVRDYNADINGVIHKGKQYQFYTVTKDPMQETAAYKAAKTADIGPNGKDVKADGTTLEIYTPQGLAWLAVMTNDDFTKYVENGKEYFPAYRVKKTYKLMADLDMTGYGEDWPSIQVYNNILDGQGHRIYNQNATGTSPSFISGISEDGIVANLIVEGNMKITSRKYSSNIVYTVGGLCHYNAGRIVNCAFIGEIYSDVTQYISIAGLAANNTTTGRIENCYVNPCGKSIKGIRPATITTDDFTPCYHERYDVARLVASNDGSVENCYFAGEIDFDNQATDNKNIEVILHEGLVGGRYGDYGNVTNCYEGSDILAETLNKNVQNHKQEKDYPWVIWAVNSDIQCGKPYLLFGSFPPVDDDVVIINDDLPYEKTHQGKHVIVKSKGIYTINEADASIISLTVEETGQVKVRKPLIITDSIIVLRQIDTDKWTTFGVPTEMNIENNLIPDVPAGQEAIWSKVGYSNENDQKWSDYGKSVLNPNTAYLLVARSESQMGHFCTKNAPFTLEAVSDTTASGSAQNGNWFYFVANPYWENLQIKGRAYILNDAGTSFELRDNPVVPPFHCYMVASEAVMNRVSSLRLSDLPTSIEDVRESGLRVWTESRTLCVESDEPRDIAVYSVNGTPQARYKQSTGTKRVTLPQGVYIVICDGKAVKVVL